MKPPAWRRPCMHNSCSLAVPMMETKTLACCKSADTSARVTVTPFTRGSCISNRIVSLATSRITSETLARRCVFMVPQVYLERFDLMIHQLGHGMYAEGFDDLPQSGLHVVRFIANHRQAE